MIDFLLESIELKDETRTGWDLRNVEDPESVGDHSWGVALLCMLFADQEDVDKEKAIKMALIHDLTEAEIGDIATRKEEEKQEISKKNKSELEEQAIEKISGLVGGAQGQEIRSLWNEFDKESTKTAEFVTDMDKIEMVLQALKYEKEGRYAPDKDNPHFEKFERLDEFFATSKPKISTETGRELFRDTKERYETAKEDR